MHSWYVWPQGCKLFPSSCRKNLSVRLADVVSVYFNTEQGTVIQIQVVTRDRCYCWMSTDRLGAVVVVVMGSPRTDGNTRSDKGLRAKVRCLGSLRERHLGDSWWILEVFRPTLEQCKNLWHHIYLCKITALTQQRIEYRGFQKKKAVLSDKTS